jgi:hypothetical protein
MAKDKEEADTWFKIGFEDEAWKEEKTNAAFQTMREQLREEKKEEAKHKRNERELSDWRGYYSLVMAANIVAGLDESTTLRTSLPSYPIWAKARSARERGWCVNGGLSRPREDFAIPVRQVQREEGWFVCLSDFIEWAIEAGCAVAPRAIEDARRECEVSDTFERRARLWQIERTQGELRSAKPERVEGILARDARLAELDRERGEIIASLRSDDPAPERIDTPAADAGAETSEEGNPDLAINRADYLREMILDAYKKFGWNESAIWGYIADAAQGKDADAPCIVAVTEHKITWKSFQGGWTVTQRKDFRGRIKRLKKAQ